MRSLRFRTALVSLLGLAAAGAALTTACGTSAAGAARAPSRRLDAPSDDHGLRGPLLWEVQGPRATSYLFGTIHTGFEADKELPAWVWDKLGACDTFVMEADLGRIDVDELQRMAALPEGESLASMMGPEDWKDLLELTGAPAARLQHQKPWFAVALVLQRLYPTPVPLDVALLRRADQQGKEIAFLEDVRRQIDVLARTITVEDLRELLRADGRGRRDTAALLAAYREGNLDELARVVRAELAENPKSYELLYSSRNRDWLPVLQKYLERGRAFVAVGAAHFPGEEGLIDLLRGEGYVLSRVVEP